jgi:hypothetical protein
VPIDNTWVRDLASKGRCAAAVPDVEKARSR